MLVQKKQSLLQPGIPDDVIHKAEKIRTMDSGN